MSTRIYVCVKYDDKVIHARDVEMRKPLAEEIMDIVVRQIDFVADTLLKVERRRF